MNDFRRSVCRSVGSRYWSRKGASKESKEDRLYRVRGWPDGDCKTLLVNRHERDEKPRRQSSYWLWWVGKVC